MSSRIVSALAAVALVAAPTVAAAQSVAPAPAQESVDGSELRGEGSGVGQVLPLFIIIAIVLLIREIVKDRDLGRQDPRSP